jgi:hypothetical protein
MTVTTTHDTSAVALTGDSTSVAVDVATDSRR